MGNYNAIKQLAYEYYSLDSQESCDFQVTITLIQDTKNKNNNNNNNNNNTIYVYKHRRCK